MPERYDYFMGLLNRPDIEVDWAKNADEFYPMLENPRYDIFFLDHDLSAEHYTKLNTLDQADHTKIECKEETGYDITKRLIHLQNDKHPDYIVVHTLNSQGGKNMMSCLREMDSTLIRAYFAFPDFQNVVYQLAHQKISKTN